MSDLPTSPDTDYYVKTPDLPEGMRQLKSQVGRPTIQFWPPRRPTEERIAAPKLSVV